MLFIFMYRVPYFIFEKNTSIADDFITFRKCVCVCVCYNEYVSITDRLFQYKENLK